MSLNDAVGNYEHFLIASFPPSISSAVLVLVERPPLAPELEYWGLDRGKVKKYGKCKANAVFVHYPQTSRSRAKLHCSFGILVCAKRAKR